MPEALAVDGRLLHYNRTGIGSYLRNLYGAVAALPVAALAPFDVRLYYHRKDREHALQGRLKSATLWTPPHHRWERWALAAELAPRLPAVVHSPDHVAPQPLGWRSVVTVHDLAFWRLPETHSAESRAYYRGVTQTMRQSARVICVSNATRQDLLEMTQGDPAKVCVVYEAPGPEYGLVADQYLRGPGGDVREQASGGVAQTDERYECVVSGSTDVPGDRPYFIFVGTMEPRKNVANILSALALLPAAGRPDLFLVGNPGYGAESLPDLARQLGIAGRVRWLGRKTAAEVAALYQGPQTLGLVYPSLLEGFGLPILEAMACGAPVITSDRSSMAEIAGNAALLVDPDDPTALAGALGRVAEDAALRYQLRELGLNHVKSFSWAHAASQTLDVFREALAA